MSRRLCGGVVAYGILVSPQSQLDFWIFTDLVLGLGLGLGGLDFGLGLDKSLILPFKLRTLDTDEIENGQVTQNYPGLQHGQHRQDPLQEAGS